MRECANQFSTGPNHVVTLYPVNVIGNNVYYDGEKVATLNEQATPTRLDSFKRKLERIKASY